MADDREVAGELVAFIRENKDELVESYIQEYDRVYGYSRGHDLPRDMRMKWIDAMTEEQVREIEGVIDPDRYLTCGGDMVLNCEQLPNKLFVFIESELFFKRYLAPRIWRRFAYDPAKVRKMADLLEERTQAAIRANTEAFLWRICQHGAISSSWNQFDAGPMRTTYVEQSPATFAPQARTADRSSSVTPLTNREAEVLGLVVDGCSNKEISRRLSMGLSTVKNHVSRIFGKFGVQSRAELLALVLGSPSDKVPATADKGTGTKDID